MYCIVQYSTVMYCSVQHTILMKNVHYSTVQKNVQYSITTLSLGLNNRIYCNHAAIIVSGQFISYYLVVSFHGTTHYFASLAGTGTPLLTHTQNHNSLPSKTRPHVMTLDRERGSTVIMFLYFKWKKTHHLVLITPMILIHTPLVT